MQEVKKVGFAFLFFIGSFCAQAQGFWNKYRGNNIDPMRDYRKHFFWGMMFTGTYNKMKINFNDYFYQKNDSILGITNSGQAGFAVGPSMSLRVGKHWEIKTGTILHIHQNDLKFEFKSGRNAVARLETVSLDQFLDFKYRSDMPSNARMYVLGGVRQAWNFQSGESLIVDANRFTIPQKSNLFYYQVGFGFEFRQSIVDMGIEFKMANAITNAHATKNVIGDNIYNRAIGGLFPRIFSITFFVYD